MYKLHKKSEYSAKYYTKIVLCKFAIIFSLIFGRNCDIIMAVSLFAGFRGAPP